MAESLLKILIDNLSRAMEEEIGIVMGVDKEMKKLQSTLSTIQSVLEDAETKQFHSKPIHNWLTNLNDAAFEIEDILDECSTEASKIGSSSSFKLKKILFSRKIGRRIKEMAQRLDDLSAERRKFHLSEISVPPSSNEVDCRRETCSILVEPDHIYGRDEDRERMVDSLVNRVSEDDYLSILPIIGVGGLGKTTLAQLVFNDQRVSRHFEAKLWVCVSDNFDLKLLLEAMIQSATGIASNLVRLDALQRRIREVLDRKRYLLVLDDVWNEDRELWVKLKSILGCGSKGSSILVTTRLKKVADFMGTVPAQSLTGLSDENLWSLFKLRALGREGEVPHNLESIGRQIVKKCGGVPLAAKALGGLLRFKREEKEWIRIRESEIWDLPGGEEAVIMPALRLSYHHLPLELRLCFAYCSIFPKDYEMEKQDLIFRWIALGCIKPNGAGEVEDDGDRIWNELILRSFFHEVNGTTAKMHDLVHDLAQSVLENKVQGSQSKSLNAKTSNNKVREVYFSKNSWDTTCSSISIKVSTLTTIMNYTKLRILKLNWARVEKLPNAIGKMKHLRYIDLTSSQISTLPPTFCNLWNLQILILNDCIQLESLPKNIKHMTNLRHIFLEGCSKLSDMPSGIKKLACLKTLSLFIVGDKVGNQLDQLQHMSLGGRLEIQHLERTKSHLNAKRANLVEKPNLRNLVLSWGEESRKEMDEKVLEALEPRPNLDFLQITGFKGSYIPLWMKRMESLTQVTIQYCPNLTHVPLGHLPHLKSLFLWSIDRLEYIVNQNQNQNHKLEVFPSLERLRFAHLPNLRGMVNLEEEVQGGMAMFPNLRELFIRECSLSKLELNLPSLQSLRIWKLCRVTSLPEWLGDRRMPVAELVIRQCPNLTSLPSSMLNLKSLAIFECPQLERRCEKEKGEDWGKISHIPHLLIR